MQVQPAYNPPQQPPAVMSAPTPGSVPTSGAMMRGGMMPPGAIPQPVWVQLPTGNAPEGTPHGLEYLASVDQIVIHQKVQMLEMFVGWELENRYAICNNLGQQIWYARESSDTCCRQCCSQHRGFNMTMEDNSGNVLWTLNKSYSYVCCPCYAFCCCCCSCGSLPELTIESPPGNIVATVSQKSACCGNNFGIYDSKENELMTVIGPGLIFGFTNQFDVVYCGGKADGQSAGVIRRQLGMMQWLTDADNYSVTFPMALHPILKAGLIGATLLIDYAFFEHRHNRGRRRRRY